MIPTARGLWLAESVTVDSRKNLSLQNCFRALRATWFPADLKRFFVVAHLVNGSGVLNVRLVVERMDSNEPVYQFESTQAFPDRLTEVRVKFEVSQCVAPGSGMYGVTFWVEDDLVAQTVFFGAVREAKE